MSVLVKLQAVHDWKWDTPLNSLRLLAVLLFLFVTVAMVFPSTQRFLLGGCVSLSGILALSLFRLKDVEEKRDRRDGEFTRLGLGKV